MDWWWEKKKKQNLERGAMLLEEVIECCDGKSNPIKFFSAHQIHEATDSFSYSNRVSQLASHFDCLWYTGKNESHPMILIKRCVFVDQRIFCRDVAISSMVSGHKNFMKLVGCCLESEVPSMVYHGVKTHDQLNQIIGRQPWKRRMKIAEDIATALAYLHTAFPRPFVYRSLIPGNIFLDEDLVARLSDFSECVSIPKGETFVKVNRIYYGDIYKDSKYMRYGVVSVETDVYAFGMLMQMFLHGCDEVWVHELFHRLTRKERSDLRNGFIDVGQLSHRINGEERSDDYIIEREVQSRPIQNWLLKLMEEGRMDEIADPKMLEKMGEISEEELSRMKAFLMLSHRCIGLRGEIPTMVEVAKELKKIQRSL